MMRRSIDVCRYGISFKKKGIIQAPQSIIYSVISQTQHYPKFIPFISNSTVNKLSTLNQNHTKLTIKYKNIKELSYTSHVKMKPSENTLGIGKNKQSIIYSVCKEQPLSLLESLWEIQEIQNNQCFVKYNLEFDFVSSMYRILAGSVLKDYMGEEMWKIFKKQSIKLYQNQKQSMARPRTNQPDLTLSNFLQSHPELRQLYQNDKNWSVEIQKLHNHLKQDSSSYTSKMKQQINKLKLKS